MAHVVPIPYSLADRDVQAIIEAYKEDPTNPKYAFQHLLFSVTEPQYRVKPSAVSDIMWAEAMSKLEGMDSTERERLWPRLVQGFKDLSQRLKGFDKTMDRISKHEILCHIVSFLSAKEAAFAAILSKRLQNHITIVSNLEFDDSVKNQKSLIDFADGVLALPITTCINTITDCADERTRDDFTVFGCKDNT